MGENRENWGNGVKGGWGYRKNWGGTGKILRLGENWGNMETGKEHHRLVMWNTTDRQKFVPCRD